MGLSDAAPRAAQGLGKHQIGQPRQFVAQALDAPAAGQILHRQPENLRVLEMAQRVHRRFGVAAAGIERGGQVLLQRLPVQRLHQLGRQQFVEQGGMALQIVRQPAALGIEFGQLRQRRRMLLQKGQIRRPAADGFEKLGQPRQGGIGLAAGGGRFDGARQHGVKQRQRGGGKPAVPAAVLEFGQRLGGSSLKTELAQSIGGIGGIKLLPQAAAVVFRGIAAAAEHVGKHRRYTCAVLLKAA